MMDERAFMDLLCDCRDAWGERRGRIHEDAIYYVDVAALGHDLMHALEAGEGGPWVERALQAIERGLLEGSDLTQNLIVVGMFEAMQGDAYRMEPADLIEARLGPASLRAWADLIEGWTGQGIRTIEHWRRVVRNGPLRTVTWREGGRGFHVDVSAKPPTVTFLPNGPTRVLGEAEVERLSRPLWPLVASALLAPDAPLGRELGTLVVDGAQGPRTITFGEACATDGKRRLVLDLEALRPSWPEPGP